MAITEDRCFTLFFYIFDHSSARTFQAHSLLQLFLSNNTRVSMHSVSEDSQALSSGTLFDDSSCRVQGVGLLSFWWFQLCVGQRATGPHLVEWGRPEPTANKITTPHRYRTSGFSASQFSLLPTFISPFLFSHFVALSIISLHFLSLSFHYSSQFSLSLPTSSRTFSLCYLLHSLSVFWLWG